MQRNAIIVRTGEMSRRARPGARRRLHQREDDGNAAHRDRAAPADRHVGRCALPGRLQPLARDEGLPRRPVCHGRRQGLDHLSASAARWPSKGFLLENNKDKAQVIVEVAFGAYGTDKRDRKVGLPGISLTPSLTTGAAVASSGISTSLNFSQTNRQDAVVKASLFAYEAKTGRLVWESAPLFNARAFATTSSWAQAPTA